MDFDKELLSFVRWWRANGMQDLVVTNGVARTPGCIGDHSCCAKVYDLGGLADVIEELLGEEVE